MAAETMSGLWRRRRLILGALLLALLAGTAALLLLEKKYTSEAIVQLDLSKRESSIGNEQISAIMLEAAAVIQGEARVIRSRAFARRVVDRLGLAQDPLYGTEESFLARQIASAMQASQFLGSAAPEVPEADPEAQRVERAVRDLMGNLTVAVEGHSYMLAVRYVAPDPDRAALIANAFANEYVEQRLQTNMENASAADEWVSRQIREAQDELQAIDWQIAEFRRRTGNSSVQADGQTTIEDATQQRLRELTSQLTTAIMNRMNEEQRLSRIQEAVRSGSVPAANDLQATPVVSILLERLTAAQRELAALRPRYGEQHPTYLEAQASLRDLRQQVAVEARRAAAMASVSVEGARHAEAELRSAIDSLQNVVVATRGEEAALRDRQRQAQAVRDRLTTLTLNGEKIKAMQALPFVPASVIVAAEPEERPTSPGPAKVLGFGILAGLGIGIAGALVMERRDQGLRTSGDVTPEMESRCLAMVPELSKAGATAASAGRAATGRGAAPFQEAIRTAAAGLGLFDPAPECRVVLVTSALEGEGKTLVCGALGHALASAGRRVLVLDATPGQPLQWRGRDGAGSMPANSDGSPAFLRISEHTGAERNALAHNRLGSVIDEFRPRYDVILLEGAPVMLLADSLILSRIADTVIFVARWAHTKQRVVDAAMRRMREHSAAVDGVILTRVNLRRHAKMNFFDDCSFYSKEKKYYEAVAGRSATYPAVAGKEA